MTTALCLNCGATKFGALVPCPKCQFHMMGRMDSMPDISLAIAFSNHHFAPETLEEFGNIIKAINQVCNDRDLAHWSFIKYIVQHHPEVLDAKFPPYLSAKTFQVLAQLDLPAVTLRESPERKLSDTVSDKEEDIIARNLSKILESANQEQRKNQANTADPEKVMRTAEISAEFTVTE